MIATSAMVILFSLGDLAECQVGTTDEKLMSFGSKPDDNANALPRVLAAHYFFLDISFPLRAFFSASALSLRHSSI